MSLDEIVNEFRLVRISIQSRPLIMNQAVVIFNGIE